MVLTSTPHWRCTSMGNCGIPRILAERTDAGPVDVSAADTEPWTRSTLRGHGGGARPLPASSRPTCTRVGLSWSGVVRTARAPGKPLNQCLRCHETAQKAPPTWSTPTPLPIAPEPRTLHPDNAGHHPSDCRPPGQPPRTWYNRVLLLHNTPRPLAHQSMSKSRGVHTNTL